MSGQPVGDGVRPPVAFALALIGFVALGIFGLGMTSLATGAEVLATPGLGHLPGAFGFTASAVVTGAILWPAVHAERPRYAAAFVAAPASVLAYAFGVWIGGLFSGVDALRALSAAGGFLTSWFALVLAVVALAAVWSGVALVRTRADRPRWPWERDEPNGL